jgi:hypothetical protein
MIITIFKKSLSGIKTNKNQLSQTETTTSNTFKLSLQFLNNLICKVEDEIHAEKFVKKRMNLQPYKCIRL